jgi:hypothetical protein
VIGLLLTRWKVGLGIFGALAVFGLFAASWHYRHAYHDEKALRKADRAAYVAAQSEATLTAQRALEATEARYQEKANAADEKTALAVSAARAATADYAGRMRVKAPSCASSAAVAASQSDGARVPETVPADTFVAVSDADLQACGVNTATLLQAREWALSITE